jgi:hypothetical protein
MKRPRRWLSYAGAMNQRHRRDGKSPDDALATLIKIQCTGLRFPTAALIAKC